MEATAKKRFVRASPKKLNRIVRLIRGKKVREARAILNHLVGKNKIPVLKTLDSAVANLKDIEGSLKLDEEEFYVKEAKVDPGPGLKRARAASFTRVSIIKRRLSHIRITVATEGG
ncbi:50S ribosomal protein L22 [candidate division WOR-3 bacterium]|uniref:Large ribosomal subunit protein uL22 n=1 Tax=candidate division WOR-3 bacterium TaxID=2052148 RepID=A0A660SF67_UNCW3|nr:MAG: 50S ribosomal protein L22 [candidate division WOR-3 bacterium]